MLIEKNINLKMLKEKLEHNHHQNTTITYNKISLIISEDKNDHLILFSDGRALIKTKTLEQAESMYSKYVYTSQGRSSSIRFGDILFLQLWC